MSDPASDHSNLADTPAPPPLPPTEETALAEDSGAEVPPIAKWRWAVHLLIMGSYPLLIALVSVFAPAGEPEAALSANLGLLTFNLVITMVSFLFFLGLAWSFSRANIDQLMLRWKRGWLPWALGLVYSVAMRLIIGVVVLGFVMVLVTKTLLSRGEPVTMDNIESVSEEFREDLTPDVEHLVDKEALVTSPLYLLMNVTLVSFVMAGFREELWRSSMLAGFKGLFPRTYDKLPGKICFVLLIAVIFGIGHLPQGISGVFLTGGLGVLLGLIMITHNSIWEATFAHSFFNATSFVLMHFLFKHPDMLENLQQQLGGQ